jgi:biopolymer transport protein ExbB/TolQ
MGVLVFFALVGWLTWYAAPAGKDWVAKGWQFVLAFWMPLSWPWLIWRGFKARRARKAAAAALAARQEDARRRRERIEEINWWLDELATALDAEDLGTADLAHDVLAGMDVSGWPRFFALRSRLNALHASRVQGS